MAAVLTSSLRCIQQRCQFWSFHSAMLFSSDKKYKDSWLSGDGILLRRILCTLRLWRCPGSLGQVQSIWYKRVQTTLTKLGWFFTLAPFRELRDFLNGLDNLHEYLKFSYPRWPAHPPTLPTIRNQIKLCLLSTLFHTQAPRSLLLCQHRNSRGDLASSRKKLHFPLSRVSCCIIGQRGADSQHTLPANWKRSQRPTSRPRWGSRWRSPRSSSTPSMSPSRLGMGPALKHWTVFL